MQLQKLELLLALHDIRREANATRSGSLGVLTWQCLGYALTMWAISNKHHATPTYAYEDKKMLEVQNIFQLTVLDRTS